MVSAVWCVIGTNGNKKEFGLAVAETAKAKTGDQVQAFNRHGASQLKVLGALATNADGTPKTRVVTTSVDGIPTVVKQVVFTVAQ
jgi:hypothetical protein